MTLRLVIDGDSVHPKVSSQLAPTRKPGAGSERALRDQLANRFFDLDVSGRRRALVDMEEQFSVLSKWATMPPTFAEFSVDPARSGVMP